MKLSQLSVAYLKMIGCVFLWGGVYHAAGNLARSFDPVGNSFIRWGVSSLIFAFMLYKKHSVEGFKHNRADWLLLFLIGIFGVTLYMTIFFYTERLISGNLIAILYSFTPCLTVLLNRLFGRSRLNFGMIVGIIIALVGAIGVINLSNKLCNQFFCKHMLGEMSLGQYMAISLGICTALYTILIDKAVKRGIKSMSIITLSALTASVTLFIISLFVTDYSLLLHMSPQYWLSLLYVIIGGTILSFMWYTQVVGVLGVGKTSVFLNGVPFATVVVGAIFYGEYISYKVLFAAFVIVIGVIITNYSGRINHRIRFRKKMST